jgi:hypothetical protein
LEVPDEQPVVKYIIISRKDERCLSKRIDQKDVMRGIKEHKSSKFLNDNIDVIHQKRRNNTKNN